MMIQDDDEARKLPAGVSNAEGDQEFDDEDGDKESPEENAGEDPEEEGEPEDEEQDESSMDLDEYIQILREREAQPIWRTQADKEMDYADGNQLGSDLLQKQEALGIPPAIEDLIGPALLSIQGYEASTRTDWRVTAAGGTGGQDVADAINSRLNEAERESKADRACSDVFRSQIGVGIGWIEVARNSDPFKYPYRCQVVGRNEISWDMQAQSPDIDDARWLVRHRWMRPERLVLAFPQHEEMIEGLSKSGTDWWAQTRYGNADGGQSTGLQNGWDAGRGWSIEESRWYNPTNKELCISEIWYRRWESAMILKAPDGRTVEFDESNEAHVLAVAAGAEINRSVVCRVRRAYWLGPIRLDDSPTPYPHAHFPYVPFWGFREDRTNVPYGYIRGMIYSQDSVNSGLSKLRWGMSAVQLIYTDGSTDMTDAQLARTISRADARIKLNAEGMARQGAKFEIQRNYQLTAQHFQILQDGRAAIERVSSVTSGFTGQRGNATSGLQEQTQVEQSNQSLGRMMDNFRAARSLVGELLMAMVIEDMGSDTQTVIIEGDAVREDRTVHINKEETDEHGMPCLSNDLQRTRLKVALEEVPSTTSYRGQQLNALSELAKSLPEQYRAALTPYLVSLTDAPFKRDIIEAIRAVDQRQTPEQIKQQIDAAVKDALAKSGHDLKARELEIKERKAGSEIREIDARSVQIGVQAAYSAMQAGAQVAQMPQIAPVADQVMQGAGYRAPSPGGDDPNFIAPVPDGPAPSGPMPGAVPSVHANTSPAYPPVPRQAPSGMRGIETPRVTDGPAEEVQEPAGVNEGAKREKIA